MAPVRPVAPVTATFLRRGVGRSAWVVGTSSSFSWSEGLPFVIQQRPTVEADDADDDVVVLLMVVMGDGVGSVDGRLRVGSIDVTIVGTKAVTMTVQDPSDNEIMYQKT